MKITIIGAGSTYTPELIEGLINRKERFPVTEIALMDIHEQKLNILGGLTKRMVEHGKMNCDVILTKSLEEALDGASFVFAQVRVGMLPARVLDEKIPKKHMLLGQETTGIGGFFKALRTIPVLMDVSAAMEKYCPDAFMINFSNPSGINAQALLNYTKTKMMGLCNCPIGMINDPLRVLGIKEAEMDYVGLNHLCFITSIRSGGRDYMHEAVNGNEEILDKLDGQQGIGKEFIRVTEAIPVGYMGYFLKPRRSLYRALSETTTRGEDCMVIEEELLKMYSDENLKIKPPELSKRGGAMYSEAAVSLAESIFSDDGAIHVVDTLNKGALPFLAYDDVVEIRAKIGKNGAEPIPVQVPGNPFVQNIVSQVKTYERYTVKAALSGSRIDAVRALSVNPLIGDVEVAMACFDEMLEAHKEYLPAFCK